MNMAIAQTVSTVPASQGDPLKPLNRRQDQPATASTATKTDSFTGTANAPKNLKVLAPLGIANRAVLVDVPSADRSLSDAFDGLKTVGGGKANARILSQNVDAWNARWDMLNSAKTTIDTSYFSIEKDAYGYAFLGALLKKQMDGVQVRVTADAAADGLGKLGFLTAGRGQDYLQEIVNHGGKAYAYNPIWLRPREAAHAGYAALASSHDKILVVDGARGITGGRNIGIDYLTEPVDRKGAWRDMDVEFTGTGPSRGLTKAFEAELGKFGVAKAIDPDKGGNWSKKDIQLLGAYEMMNLWLNDPALSDAQKTALRADAASRKTMVDDLVKRALTKVQTDLPADQRRSPSKADVAKLTELGTQLVEQLEARGSRQTYLAGRVAEHAADVKIVDQTSAAAGTIANGIAPSLKSLVDSAKHHIVLENPYVVLTEDMLKSLEAASKRGVKIDIITNSPLSTDSAVTQSFFLEDWPMVLARCENARIFVATGDRKFHTKSAVIDGEQTFVSTYNLDLLSGKVNSEVGAVVKSKDAAKDLNDAFQRDLADKSNGFLEYTIEKNADGHPVLKDGKPIPKFGPENHLPQNVLDEYASKRKLWGQTLRYKLPQLEPLRHPARIAQP